MRKRWSFWRCYVEKDPQGEKNLQLLSWNWVFSEELSFLSELMERYFLNNWLIHVYKILFPRYYRKWFLNSYTKRKISGLYAGHLVLIFKEFCIPLRLFGISEFCKLSIVVFSSKDLKFLFTKALRNASGFLMQNRKKEKN